MKPKLAWTVSCVSRPANVCLDSCFWFVVQRNVVLMTLQVAGSLRAAKTQKVKS